MAYTKGWKAAHHERKRDTLKNSERKIPVMEKINTYLSECFESGATKPGDRLPSRSVLAKKFNVSLGTVSVALRRLAKKHPLKFVPGSGVFLSERDIDKGTFTIGLVGPFASQVARNQTSLIEQSYWANIAQSIMHCCDEQNLAMLVIPDTSQEPLDIDRIESFGASCLVTHGVSLRKETVFEFKRRGIPLLLGNRGDGSLSSLGASYVDYDVVGCFRDAVSIFNDRGHERIACIFLQSSDEAWATWRDAFCMEGTLRGLHLPPQDYCRMKSRGPILDTNYAKAGEFLCDQTKALLDLPKPPTAIFYHVESYLMESVLETLDKRGVEVGRDLSIMCLALADRDVQPQLSVFMEQAEALGRQMVETAVKLAHAPHEVFQIDVPFTFIDRGSIARIGAQAEVEVQSTQSGEHRSA